MSKRGYLIIEHVGGDGDKSQAEILPLPEIVGITQMRENDEVYLHVNLSTAGTYKWRQVSVGDYVTLVLGGNKTRSCLGISNISVVARDIAEYAFNELAGRD